MLMRIIGITRTLFVYLMVSFLVLGLYYYIAFNSSEFRRIFLVLDAQTCLWFFFPILVLCFVFPFSSPKNSMVNSFFLVLAIIAFSMPLFHSWTTAQTTYYRLGGLLPWTDAANYWFGGTHLLEEGHLDYWSVRRPLNAAFFAVRLALTGHDFRYALLLQAGFLGMAVWLASRVVSVDFGRLSGFFLFFILFIFGIPNVDNTFSESLGLTMGSLSFVLLWNGARDQKGVNIGLGLVLLTLALNARSGAFFILPALAFWWGVTVSGEKKFSWRRVGIGLVCILIGFVLNQILLVLFGIGSKIPHTNLTYTLYGLSRGGVGWEEAYYKFSNLDKIFVDQAAGYLDESLTTRIIFHETLQNIINHPFNLLKGLAKGIVYYSFGGGFYGFIKNGILFILCNLFALASLFFFWKQRQERRAGLFFLFSWGGILASIPFIYKDGGERVLSTTIPFIAAPAAIGFAVFVSKFFSFCRLPLLVDAGNSIKQQKLLSTPLLIVGGAVVILLIAGPWIVLKVQSPPVFSSFQCPESLRPVIIEAGPGSPHLSIVPDRELDVSFAPQVRMGDFFADPLFSGVEIGPFLNQFRKSFPDDFMILFAFDMTPTVHGYNKLLRIFGPRHMIPEKDSYLSLCVFQPKEDFFSQNYIFFPRSVEKIEPRRKRR